MNLRKTNLRIQLWHLVKVMTDNVDDKRDTRGQKGNISNCDLVGEMKRWQTNNREIKHEMFIQRGADYFRSKQTANDSSIPAALTKKQKRGKSGEGTSIHARKAVIILISPCLNLNRKPKLECAAQGWDSQLCVCQCLPAMNLSHVCNYPQVESLLCKNLFTSDCVPAH